MVITKVNNELQFSNDSDAITTDETYPIYNMGEGDDPLKMYYIKNNEPEEIYRGTFLLEPLLSFTKCTGLSNFVELKLENDKALIVKYSVGALGTIQLMLSQKT